MSLFLFLKHFESIQYVSMCWCLCCIKKKLNKNPRVFIWRHTVILMQARCTTQSLYSQCPTGQLYGNSVNAGPCSRLDGTAVKARLLTYEMVNHTVIYSMSKRYWIEDTWTNIWSPDPNWYMDWAEAEWLHLL